MALAFVQGKSGAASTGTTVGTAVSSPATITGNTIVVATATNDITSPITSVTDTGGSTYVKATSKVTGAYILEIWYSSNITGHSSNVVTANFTNADNIMVVSMQELSGLATKASLDKVASASGTSVAPASGAVTTTETDEFLVGAVLTTGVGTPSLGTGYRNLTADTSNIALFLALENKIAPEGSQQAAFSLDVSDDWVCAFASFIHAPSAPKSANYNLKTSLQSSTGLTTNFSLSDLEKAYFTSLQGSRTDSIRAFLQSQTGLTTNQSLGDLWRQFFIGKGVTNQVSLTDMANNYFSYQNLP